MQRNTLSLSKTEGNYIGHHKKLFSTKPSAIMIEFHREIFCWTCRHDNIECIHVIVARAMQLEGGTISTGKFVCEMLFAVISNTLIP